MQQGSTRSALWLRRVCFWVGLLVLAGGLHWIWDMKSHWPRNFSDPVRAPILEAMGVIIGGLYLVSKGRQASGRDGPL